MPLSFTCLSLMGRLASKVSSKCFFTEFSKFPESSIKLMGLSYLINIIIVLFFGVESKFVTLSLSVTGDGHNMAGTACIAHPNIDSVYYFKLQYYYCKPAHYFSSYL